MVQRRAVPIYSDDETQRRLEDGFGYCFVAPAGSSYPPFLTRRRIAAGRPFTIDRPGGPIAIEPIDQQHGEIRSLGFRIGSLAYSCDFNDLPPAARETLDGLDIWVLGALRPKPHPSHCSLQEALGWIERLKPRRAILTHMTADLDYRSLRSELPAGVEPAYDGLAIEFEGGAGHAAGEERAASLGS
jgi:phosphoribosyl 1,2-cyclic phosphate phosphodiesterase